MLITQAFAQDAATAAAAVSTPSAPGFLTSIAPLLVILCIFYLLVLRPQNKRMIEHRAMLNKMEKGDRVITGGGLVATVVKLVGDDEVILDLGQGNQVTALRSTIMMKKPETVPAK